MLRNLLISAAALSTIAFGSAQSASASGYYSNHNYKPHYSYKVKKHFKRQYNYDYGYRNNHNYGYNNHNYYVQNDCGWQTVKIVRWIDGYKYFDYVQKWTCSGY